MARVIAYNRKINAPIRFLYYLEVFDLFILLVFGALAPLAAGTFLPVDIPIYHSVVWFVFVFFFIIIIKVGRAPGFVQHWLGKTFRPNSFRPGLKELNYFKLPENPDSPAQTTGGSPFSVDELTHISASVRRLRQERKEQEMMQDQFPLGN